MKTKRQHKKEQILEFAFADGMMAWVDRLWNPPRNPELFKEYCKGYDYVSTYDYDL